MLEQLATGLPSAGATALAIGAVVLGGLMRGFSGFGAALVIIPVVAVVYDPKTAVVLHALIEIPALLQLLPEGLRHFDRATVLPMLGALLVSVPAGMYMLVSLDADVMRVVMALSVLAMVALIASGLRVRSERFGPPVSAAGGLIGGFLQGNTGIGGPPIVTILMSHDTPHRVTRANIIVMMASLIVTALPSMYFYNLFNARTLLLALFLGPVYVLSLYAGTRFFNSGAARLYRKASMSLLILTAIGTLFAALF